MRRRHGHLELAGLALGLPWAPAFGAPRAARAVRPLPIRSGAAEDGLSTLPIAPTITTSTAARRLWLTRVDVGAMLARD
jgi:hypothetical protein